MVSVERVREKERGRPTITKPPPQPSNNPHHKTLQNSSYPWLHHTHTTQQPQYPHPNPQQPYMMMPPKAQPMWRFKPHLRCGPLRHRHSTTSTSIDEVCTLWIGDLQYWMDKNYPFTPHHFSTCFLFVFGFWVLICEIVSCVLCSFFLCDLGV